MRFEIPTDAPLRPFVIAASREGLGLPSEVRWVDPFMPENTAFCVAMNRANCMAYDGTPHVGANAVALGMPQWVMLDCCLLPAGVFGFEVPRQHVPATVAAELDPTGTCEWLGVSEYIALPSTRQGQVVGVSLFSFVSRRSLGRRTKGLALASLGAHSQMGVTQWTSPGIPLHLEFGDMRVDARRVPVHNRVAYTFVYSVDLPSHAVLIQIYHDGPSRPTDAAGDLIIDPRVEDVGARLGLEGSRAVLVGCGPVENGEVTSLSFRFHD
jgi:hypothetical protein